MVSCDESILLYADQARAHEHARALASRMVASSREAHDFGAMSRWGRRYAELVASAEAGGDDTAPTGGPDGAVEDWYATTDLNREPAD